MSMRIVSGRVVDGKVVVADGSLDEGATVTILATDDEESFDLSAADERAILSALEQADRGEVEPASVVLERLRPAD